MSDALLRPTAPSPVAPAAPAETAAVVVPPIPATPAPEPVAPEADPKFAAKFAALSRREAQARERDQALKQKETQYSAYEKEIALLSSDPLKFLESKGLSFDKLTQIALNEGKKPAELRVQELEERLAREAKEREDGEKSRAQVAYDAQRQAFVADISDFISKNASNYELTSVSDEAAETVYNVIEQHWQTNKRVLPIEDAVRAVEAHFEKIVDERYLKLNKIQAKFKPKETTPADPAAHRAAQSPTLTNAHASTVPTPADQKRLDVESSKREAAKLIKWT